MLPWTLVKRLIVLIAVACSDLPEQGAAPAPREPAPKVVQGRHAASEPDAATCRHRLKQVLLDPSLPGAERLERLRPQILGRAKATPVLFLEEPRRVEHDFPEAQALRLALARDPTARGLGRLYRLFYRRPELARAVLLRDGYLFTDEPQLAFALLQKVELDHLFQDEQVYIQRGSETLVAVRQDGEYTYASGREAGQRAKILLFDRVWAPPADPGPALHVDLEPLAEALGFWKARLEHATKSSVVLNLLYGEQWVMTLLDRDGASLHLNCELVPTGAAEIVAYARSREREQQQAVAQLRRVMQMMVQEALPFDEPKTEEGQQDGNLRPKWRGAYRRGEWTYEFNEDKYPVFDSRGRPRVPQVCIDFVTDTLERASGTWWGTRDEPRSRRQGRFTLDAFGIDNPRSVERFAHFAWQNPDHFDVYVLNSEERIPLARGDELFDHLAAHAARYRPGDIVSILGLKSDEKYHYHSFFVYKADPVSGMPIWLASNAGRPRLRSWYGELLSAPRRSIKSRIRPRLEWLRTILDAEQPLAGEPTGGGESSG